MKTQKILEQYGLKERHAKIYLASLELGSASIQQISNKSGFARSTCDAVLTSLQQKGYISSFRKKSIKYYSPEDPTKIVNLAKEKSQLLEDNLPQFKALFNKGDIFPSVRTYQGAQGMISVLKEILEEADELLGVGSVDDVYNVLGEYFPSFTQRRIDKKIPAKIILKDSPKAHERQKLGPQQLREVKIFKGEYPCTGIIFIWKNKVAMFSLKNDLIALVIESRELADIHRAMFSLIWKTLPGYSPK